MLDPRGHWEDVYKSKAPMQVSWYQTHLEKSLELINESGIGKTGSIIDVGGGASTLVDDLLEQGYKELTVLDISSESFGYSQKRLGEKAKQIKWIEVNILEANFPSNKFDLWHDRAVFHFLTSDHEIQAYIKILKTALKPGGMLIIGSFSLDGGPLKCSGLDVMRYNPDTLRDILGADFSLIQSIDENHQTPFNSYQKFVYCLFRKIISEVRSEQLL